MPEFKDVTDKITRAATRCRLVVVDLGVLGFACPAYAGGPGEAPGGPETPGFRAPRGVRGEFSGHVNAWTRPVERGFRRGATPRGMPLEDRPRRARDLSQVHARRSPLSSLAGRLSPRRRSQHLAPGPRAPRDRTPKVGPSPPDRPQLPRTPCESRASGSVARCSGCFSLQCSRTSRRVFWRSISGSQPVAACSLPGSPRSTGTSTGLASSGVDDELEVHVGELEEPASDFLDGHVPSPSTRCRPLRELPLR